MGKRSSFERKPRDYYPTPINAVKPLIPHLPENFCFVEPCAGDGRLVEHLVYLTDNKAIPTLISDIEPQGDNISEADVFDVTVPEETDYIITNPPWDRKILHPLIMHLCSQKPTWLLFDANWMFTKQASDYLKYCEKIVTIGRVKWIEDSKMTGKDDSCWYLFTPNPIAKPIFFGKNISP